MPVKGPDRMFHGTGQCLILVKDYQFCSNQLLYRVHLGNRMEGKPLVEKVFELPIAEKSITQSKGNATLQEI